MTKFANYAALVIAVLALVVALTGGKTVVQKLDLGGVTNFDSLALSEDLTVAGTAVITGGATLTGEVTMKEASATIAATDQWATTTLTAAQSGTTFYLSGKGTTITLPAVTEGVNFRFVVGGALDTANVIIDSAEGDNIEGSLIVAGAVVDCAAVDQINFVVDGENIGDYVEVRSDGTQWLIGDSGVLTSAKMTCTDPS